MDLDFFPGSLRSVDISSDPAAPGDVQCFYLCWRSGAMIAKASQYSAPT